MNEDVVYVFIDAKTRKGLVHFLKMRFEYDFSVAQKNLYLEILGASVPYDFTNQEHLTEEGRRYINLFSVGEIDSNTRSDISSWQVNARLDKIFKYIKNYDRN